jgi:hypothetical protein
MLNNAIASKVDPLTGGEDPGIPPAMIRILSPSNLPPSYQLQIKDRNESVFHITVPGNMSESSGVKEGEVFLVPRPVGYVDHGDELNLNDHDSIPRGHWRDSMYNFCRYGPCHPSLLLAIFFRPQLMAQIMERNRLTWCGDYDPFSYASNKKANMNEKNGRTGTGNATALNGTEEEVVQKPISTFTIVMLLYIGYLLFDRCLGIYMGNNTVREWDDDKNGWTYIPQYPDFVRIIQDVVGLFFFVYFVRALTKARRNVRNQFSIPEEQCHGCEDLCCSLFCACCTVSQIARHTNDYDKNPASCCSPTGLGPHVPMAAPMTV